jgi:hypothetical protein
MTSFSPTSTREPDSAVDDTLPVAHSQASPESRGASRPQSLLG